MPLLFSIQGGNEFLVIFQKRCPWAQASLRRRLEEKKTQKEEAWESVDDAMMSVFHSFDASVVERIGLKEAGDEGWGWGWG